MKKNTWTVVSNHRTGSTVVCQYIGLCQAAEDHDEIFHPNAVRYGHGPHGQAIKHSGDALTYYRNVLLADDWVVKAVPVHVLEHPSLDTGTILTLLLENTTRWVVLTRRDTFKQFVSFLLMGMVNFHHKTLSPQPEWNFTIEATREQYEQFRQLNSHFAGMLKILKHLKIDYDQICYEDLFSSPHAFSGLSSALRLRRDLGQGFLGREGVCQKLSYDHDSCLSNAEEVREWIRQTEISAKEGDAERPVFSPGPNRSRQRAI